MLLENPQVSDGVNIRKIKITTPEGKSVEIEVGNAFFGSDEHQFMCVTEAGDNYTLTLGSLEVTRFWGGRCHFSIFEDGDKLFIQDMGSWNGTYLDSDLLHGYVKGEGSDPFPLPHRCRIRAGLAEIDIEIIDSGAASGSVELAEPLKRESSAGSTRSTELAEVASSTLPEESSAALEMENTGIKRLIGKGVFFTKEKRYDEAIAVFDKLLTVDPQDPTGWYLKSLAYAGMGNREMSQRSMEKAKRYKLERARKTSTTPSSPTQRTVDGQFMDPSSSKEHLRRGPGGSKFIVGEDHVDEYAAVRRTADPLGSDFWKMNNPTANGSSSQLALYKDRERHLNRSLIDRYGETLGRMRQEVSTIKEIGIDVGSVEYLLKLSTESLAKQDLDMVATMLKKADHILEGMKGSRLKDVTAASIIKANELFASVSENEIDVENERSMLQKVVIAFQEEDYLKASHLAQMVIKGLKGLKAGSSAKEEAISLLKDIRGMIKDAILPDEYLEPIADRINEAGGHLRNGRFEDAKRMAFEVWEELVEMTGPATREMLDPLIEAVSKDMVKARELSIDVDEESEGMFEVEILSKDGNYNEASSKVNIIKESLKAKIFDRIHTGRKRKIDEAKKDLAEIKKESGLDFEDLQSFIDIATKSFEMEDYDRVDTVIRRFHKKKEEYSSKLYLVDYSIKIDNLRSKMTVLKDLDVDLDKCEESLDMARESIDAKDFNKVEDHITRAERIINDINEHEIKKIAKKLYPKTKDMLRHVESIGGEVKKENDLVERAIRAFRKRNYIETCRLCMKVKEDLKTIERCLAAKDETGSLLREIEAMIERATELGLDLGEIVEEVHRVGVYLEEEKFEKAKQITLEVKERLGGQLDDTYRQDLESEIRDVSLVLQRARELDLDVEGFSRTLYEVEALTDRAKYTDAMEKMRTLKPELMDLLYEKEHLGRERSIDEAAKELTFLQQETGRKYPELRNYLSDASKSLEKDDYAVTDDLLARFFREKRETGNRYYRDKYSSRIEEIFTQTGIIKELGIDIEKCEETIKETLVSLETEDFESTKEGLSRSENIIAEKNSVEVKKIAKKLFPKTKEFLTEVEQIGENVTGEREIMNRALAAFREKDYINTCKLCIEAKVGLERISGEVKVREDAVSRVKEAQEMLKRATDLELYVVPIKDLLRKARIDLKKKAYAAADGTAKKALARLTKIIRSVFEKRQTALHEEINRTLEKARKLGISVEEFEAELSDFENLKDVDKQHEALARLEEQSKAIESKIHREMHGKRENGIVKAREDLLSFQERTGKPYTELHACLDSAQDSLNFKDYDSVDGYLEEFHMYKEEYAREFFHHDYNGRIERLRGKIELINDMGVETASAEESMKFTEEMLLKEDFEGLKGIMARVEALIMEKNRDDFKRKAKKLLPKMKGLIVRVEQEGGNVKEAKQVLDRALRSFREKDYIDTYRSSLEVQEILTRVREELTKKSEAISNLKGLKRLIGQSSLPKGDIENIKEIIRNTKQNIRKREYSNALSSSKKAYVKMTEMTDNQKKIKVESLIGEVSRELEAVGELELNVEEFTKRLSEAKEMKDNGEYDKAASMAEAVNDSIRKKIQKEVYLPRKQRLNRALKELKSFKEETGRDYEELVSSLNVSIEALKGRDFDRSDTYLEEFQMYMDEYRRRHYLKKYTLELDKLRSEVDTIKREGMDVGAGEESLDAASRSFKEEDFNEVEKEVKKVKDNINDLKEGPLKDITKARISEFKELMIPLKKGRFKVKPFERTFSEAMIAFREGKYVKSLDLTAHERDKLLKLNGELTAKKGTIALLRETRERIKGSELVDLDLAPVEEIVEEAKQSLKKKDFSSSLPLAKRAREKLDEMIDNEYRRKLELHIGEISREFEKAKKLNLNIDDLRGSVKNAVHLSKEKRYAEAIDLTESIRTSLENSVFKDFHSGVKRRIIEASKEYAWLQKETGNEYQDIADCIENAKKALRRKDYEEVDSYLEEFQMFKDEYVRTYNLVKYNTFIEKLLSDADFLRDMGFDVKPLDDLTVLIKDALEKEDFEEVGKRVEKAETILNDLNENRVRKTLKDNISEMNDLLRHVNEKGSDVTDEKRLVRKAQKAYKDANFKESWTLVLKAKADLLDLLEEHEARAKEEMTRERTSSLLRKINKRMAVGVGLGLDVSSIRDAMEISNTHIEMNELDEAERITVEADEQMEGMIGRKIPEVLNSRMREFRSRLDDAKSDGIDIGEEMNIIEKVTGLMESNDSLEGIGVLREALASFDEKMKEHRKSSYLRAISKFEEELDGLEIDAGEVLRDIRSSLMNARKAVDREKFASADIHLEEFSRNKEEYRIDHYSNLYTNEIKELEEEVARLKNIGLDMTETEEITGSSKESISSYNFEDTKLYIAEIRKQVDDARTTGAEELAKGLLRSIESLGEEMRRDGIDTKKSDTYIQTVREMIDRGEFLRGAQKMRDLKKKMHLRKKEHHRGLAMVARNEIFDMFKECKKLGLDTTEIEEQIETSESYFERERFEDSHEVLLRGRVSVQKLLEKEFSERIRSGLIKINETREMALARGIDVAEEVEGLSEIYELEKEGEYWRAEEQVSKIAESLENKIEKDMIEKNTDNLHKAKNSLKILREETGKDFPDLASLLEEVLKAFNKEDPGMFDTALEKYNKAKREYEEKYYLKRYTQRLASLEKDALNFREIGLDTAAVDEVVGKSKENLDSSDFQLARENIKRSEEMLFDIKTVYARDMVKKEFANTMKLYGLLSKAGMVLEKDKEMIERVLAIMKKHEYIECLPQLLEVKANLMKSRDEYFTEKTRTYLEQDGELLKEAEEMGVETQSIEETMKKARELLEGQKTRDAMVLALESRNELREKIDEKYNEMYDAKKDSLEVVLAEAKDRGVDIREELNAVSEMEKYKEEGRYHECISAMEYMVSSLRKRIKIQKRKIYEMRLENITPRNKIEPKERRRDNRKESAHDVEWYFERSKKDDGTVSGETRDDERQGRSKRPEKEIEIEKKDSGATDQPQTSQRTEKPISGPEEGSTRSSEPRVIGKVEPRKVLFNMLRSSKQREREQVSGEVADARRSAEPGKKERYNEDAKRFGSRREEESGVEERSEPSDREASKGETKDEVDDVEVWSSKLTLNPDQEGRLRTATKEDLKVIKMMLDGNVFRRPHGRRYNLFRRGINGAMEDMVADIGRNNHELEPDEIVDELRTMLFQ